MIDPTVFYYTFSTICQTLAGAFGFLVAIVLYRIQDIAANRQGHAEKLAEVIKLQQAASSLPFNTTVAGFDHHRQAIALLDELLVLVKKHLRFALYATVSTILFSLTTMALIPLIIAHGPAWVPWSLLALAIVGTFFAVFTYVNLCMDGVR